MTANFTNSPNLQRVAETLARLMADRAGGEVADVKIERKEESDESIQGIQ